MAIFYMRWVWSYAVKTDVMAMLKRERMKLRRICSQREA